METDEQRDTFIDFVRHMLTCPDVNIQMNTYRRELTKGATPSSLQKALVKAFANHNNYHGVPSNTIAGSPDKVEQPDYEDMVSFTLTLEKSGNNGGYCNVDIQEDCICFNTNTSSANVYGQRRISVLEELKDDLIAYKEEYDKRQFEKSLQIAMSITGYARKHRARKFI